MKKYYAITKKRLVYKTVLVPVDAVEDIEDAIDLVDENVEFTTEEVMESEEETNVSPYADSNGVYELDEEEAEMYEIITQ